MKYLSSRNQSAPVQADMALRSGAAQDGGLFLPEHVPPLPVDAFDGLTALPDIATRLLAPFFTDSALDHALPAICAASLDLPAPLVCPDQAQPGRHVLELFHGPTGAFKDFGARFLMRCFREIGDPSSPLTILVATSGDTGGAVGCAAEAAGGIPAVILFPRGRISDFQQQQLSCWDKPVTALRVERDFDACQALVKSAFSDPALTAKYGLTSANSINIARFLPQMSYWAKAALEIFRKTGIPPGLVIPTGNLGNAFAALMARACGLPIGPVIISTNANATLSNWFETATFKPRASIATLANAMDVGTPSNFERLARYEGFEIEAVERVTDAQIEARIQSEYNSSGYIACPHTATALEAHARLPDAQREERPWLIAATAHPYKFSDIVEPLIGQEITAPTALSKVMDRPVRLIDIPASQTRLADILAAI